MISVIHRWIQACRDWYYLRQLRKSYPDAGKAPIIAIKCLGQLPLRSGVLLIGDPGYLPGLELPQVGSDLIEFSATLIQYPSGIVRIKQLLGAICEVNQSVSQFETRRIGSIAIDSAKLVILDKADYEEHWAEIGRDRIGVISTAPDDTVLKLLIRKFKLKCIKVNAVRAEIEGPVPEELEREILQFLRSDERYSRFPFMHFRVDTNNSSDRIMQDQREWSLIPVGNLETPLLFTCNTGYGDGVYEVMGEFEGEVLRRFTITFIE